MGTVSNYNHSGIKLSNVKIVLRVYMHCEGCVDQISKCLNGFEGVEEVAINAKDHKVIVKGKNVDPLKIVEKLQKKCNKHVELLSPKPKPNEKHSKEPKQKQNEDEPLVMIVVLKVYMHCENCAQEIKKSIERMKGVQTAEPDPEKSEVTVTGAFDPPKLVEFLYKRAGKHAVIVKEEYKEKEKEKEKAKKRGRKKGKKDFYCHYPPLYSFDHVYPSNIFSDENANSCSIM